MKINQREMQFEKALVVLLIAFLAACRTGPEETVSSSPVALDTTPEIALVPSQTRTPRPTKTPSPTLQTTETVPAATANGIGTKEAIRDQLVNQIPRLGEYIAHCRPTYCYGFDVSPDEQWVYFSDEDRLEIFNITGQRVGKYSFQEVSGRSDVVEGSLTGIHWSNDGQYLYLATSFGDGGPGPHFGYKYSLARVNLQNGTWRDTGISGVLSFSPNDKYIIYSTNTSEIRIRQLQSGQEKIYITPEYYQYFGEFVWSPDGKNVIFVAAPNDFDGIDEKFALFMIDLESDKNILLFEDLMPYCYPVAWVEDSKVTLNKFQEDGTWVLDLTATPPAIRP